MVQKLMMFTNTNKMIMPQHGMLQCSNDMVSAENLITMLTRYLMTNIKNYPRGVDFYQTGLKNYHQP
jgi:hypothetical protein